MHDIYTGTGLRVRPLLIREIDTHLIDKDLVGFVHWAAFARKIAIEDF